MKRLVLCATKSQIANRIVNGFTRAGCSNISVLDQSDNYCELKLTLPSGKVTTTTVWYDYNNVRNGHTQTTSLQRWNSVYTVNANGDVYDNNGNFVGEAYVRIPSGTKQSHRKNYQYNSIRTDSGDVIIDHPDKAKNYSTVVKTLENRVVFQRS